MLLGNLLGSVRKKYRKISIEGICFDSRKVKKKDIFFAIKGNQTSGTKFIKEAISRGAKYCYFYEIAKEVIETLESNCLKICEYNNYKIIKKDITKSFFEEIDNPLSVIFIDPPYTLAPFENILHNLLKANLILKDTIIIIESEKKTKINFPYLMKTVDERYYGKTKITFLCLID